MLNDTAIKFKPFVFNTFWNFARFIITIYLSVNKFQITEI